MEDRSLHGGMSKGKNFFLPVVRRFLSPPKLCEVESLFVFLSSVTAGHSSNMDLLGTRFGQLMRILRLSVLMIPMPNPSLTYCLNHPKKISNAGPIVLSFA
ncbi:hypothetical protein Golob_016964 [Gossypium lobatum]|uniref:Uncharacterized protein n=1 Tax=Gossypium lobatum TaxID=34289 RepID=A0A7J8M5P8_9ROSI|nr:hypothetical protein [Gossypium lobatum]